MAATSSTERTTVRLPGPLRGFTRSRVVVTPKLKKTGGGDYRGGETFSRRSETVVSWDRFLWMVCSCSCCPFHFANAKGRDWFRSQRRTNVVLLTRDKSNPSLEITRPPESKSRRRIPNNKRHEGKERGSGVAHPTRSRRSKNTSSRCPRFAAFAGRDGIENSCPSELLSTR